MKKLRFLIVIYSFGLMLAFASITFFVDGGVLGIDKVYAQGSKNFGSISPVKTSSIEVSPIYALVVLLLVVLFISLVLIAKKVRKPKENQDKDE